MMRAAGSPASRPSFSRLLHHLLPTCLHPRASSGANFGNDLPPSPGSGSERTTSSATSTPSWSKRARRQPLHLSPSSDENDDDTLADLSRSRSERRRSSSTLPTPGTPRDPSKVAPSLIQAGALRTMVTELAGKVVAATRRITRVPATTTTTQVIAIATARLPTRCFPTTPETTST
jgi:hypothetical protein